MFSNKVFELYWKFKEANFEEVSDYQLCFALDDFTICIVDDQALKMLKEIWTLLFYQFAV